MRIVCEPLAQPATMSIRVHRGGKGAAPSLFSGPGLVYRNIKEHSTLTRHFIRKDLKLAYHGTFLGYAWTLLEPLIFTIILYMVYVILRGATDELIALKVMLGILFWGCFSTTVSSCTGSLVGNSGLINQVYLPREIFPVSIVGYQMTRLALSSFIIIPMMMWYQLAPSIHLLLLFPAMIGVGMFAIGVGMITAILQVRIRDVSQIIGLVLRAGFFLSGVMFAASDVPVQWLEVHMSNPMVVYIEMARTAVLADFSVLELRHILVAFTVSFLTMLIGMSVFKKFESRMVKYL